MFYDNLNKLCKKKNTTVSAVLKAIGIGTANGTFWKKGSVPSSENLVKLANFLEVTTDSLLYGEEETKQSINSEAKDPFENFNVPPERMEFVRLFYQLPEERQKDMLSILKAIVEREQKNKSQSND